MHHSTIVDLEIAYSNTTYVEAERSLSMHV